MKFKLVIASVFLLVADLSAASPALTIRDYQSLALTGAQGEQTISTYLIATIDAIGMTNEFIIGRKDQPVFCQKDRTITVDMVRAIIDKWIARNQPTMSPERWKVYTGKLNLTGAVLESLRGALPCNG
jgi:hypothetical protein